ncbi:MAG: MBL fold metallo-hydrolase [Epsilonproteobacteria bacterium]|nr:MBL fold metallo-hydrolase [Campylobacterota bacterium]
MLKILSKPFGTYQTNCYIVKNNDNELIIDPGVGATKWVKDNTSNPLAVLNTHGHFDHTWSDCELKDELNIPIYIPKGDAFMLEKDVFEQSQPVCKADILVDGDSVYKIGDFEVRFIHFPGHTPGTSVIEIGDFWFSGDFIFRGSIGRVDFPYSNPKLMKESLQRFKKIGYDKTVYTGHGEPTTIKQEQSNVDYWLRVL